MTNYSCVIVDDEPLARQLLISYSEKIPYLNVVGICQNAIEARMAIQECKPDILFIDIQMPNLNGIDLLRMLKIKPATILTTAFSEYALEGYDLDVIDYLLKPIEFERFFKATNKCIDFLGKNSINSIQKDGENADFPLQNENKDNYFFVKSDYKTVKILFDDIHYIEALHKYVRIHTNKERIVTLMSMNQLEDSLPQHQFVRIHRSHIINIDNIESIEGNLVTIGKFKLPISKSQRDSFFEIIKSKHLVK